MVIKTLDQHIEITPGTLGGKPRIAGHRISVQDVVIWHNELGYTVEKIAEDYNLSLADVHAALAYYYDHKEEVDRSIREGEKFVEEMKKELAPVTAEAEKKEAERPRLLISTEQGCEAVQKIEYKPGQPIEQLCASPLVIVP